MRTSDTRKTDSQRGERPHRKPYTRPALKSYGHVSRLTQSGGSTRPEAGNPAMRSNCL